MRYAFLTLLFLAIVVLIYLVRKVQSRRQFFPSTIIKLMNVGLIVEICHVVIMLTTQVYLSSFAYWLYLVATEWMGYYLVLFSLEYIGEANHPWFKKQVVIGLIMADTVSLGVNIVTEHLYSLVRYSDDGFHFWYVMDITSAFFTHLFWTYFIITLSIICMGYKALKTSAIYRKKYFFMLVVLSLVGIFDSLFIFFHWPCNFSVPMYTMVAGVLYYFAIRFIPKGLINETLGLVIDKYTDGVVIEEDDGRRIYTNAAAKRFLSMTPELNGVMENWRVTNQHEKLAFKEIHNYYELAGNEKVYYNLRFNRITDKEGKYIGDIYMIMDETETILKRERERYESMHDALTTLYRKEYFYIKVREELAAFPDKEYMMVVFDIDRLKMINDLFGYDTGDRVLRHFGDMMRHKANVGEVYGYLGDDHFAWLIPTNRFSMKLFNSLEVEAITLQEGYSYGVRFYAGIYRISDRTLEPNVMCDRATMAISTIKGNYERNIAFYDENLRENMLQEQSIVDEIDIAMESGQIELFVQPQTNSSGEVMGGEVLVQWRHPEKGVIPAVGFVPILEEKNLIYKLDCFVWEKACIYLRRWIDKGRDDMYLSVNISPKDLYMMNIYEVFTDLVEKYDIPPQRLNLEITESAIMLDVERQVELISRLQDYGFSVEMDDFGSGYSSLNTLKDITVDTLKIDMGFLDAKEGERGRIIVAAITEMAKDLGMKVICEGVETYEQMKFLKKVGCDVFQGYFFSKSMEITKFEDMYIND
ncbi:MAG: EAL domain-containing protein [Lachnospiraceae bacterium]|nr:EAL domain-containing protein [Lachnospiraceae bacterium]